MLRSFLTVSKFSRKFSSNVVFISDNLLNETQSKKTRLNASLLHKLNSLPVQINTNNFDLATLDRLNICSSQFLSDLVRNLDDYGLKEKLLSQTLKSHEDWSLLSRSNLNNASQLFRELSFPPEIYLQLIAKNSKLISIEKRKLELRMQELRQFFTNKQLNNVLVRTPDLLTNNFDLFRYKFTYVFVLMGVGQKQMCATNLFDCSVGFIRERHLFLERAGLFDKPNKKGVSKVENPKLSAIFDTNLKEYLRICTGNLFGEQDYEAFCEYLARENLDDELLGNRIGGLLQNQIVKQIRRGKFEERLEKEDDDDELQEKISF